VNMVGVLLQISCVYDPWLLMCSGLCPDWPQFNPKNAVDNAKKAMDAAEKWMDVPQVRMSLFHNFRMSYNVVVSVHYVSKHIMAYPGLRKRLQLADRGNFCV